MCGEADHTAMLDKSTGRSTFPPATPAGRNHLPNLSSSSSVPHISFLLEEREREQEREKERERERESERKREREREREREGRGDRASLQLQFYFMDCMV